MCSSQKISMGDAWGVHSLGSFPAIPWTVSCRPARDPPLDQGQPAPPTNELFLLPSSGLSALADVFTTPRLHGSRQILPHLREVPSTSLTPCATKTRFASICTLVSTFLSQHTLVLLVF